MRNDETMVFDADFCRDGIVDSKESIDAKRTTKNDDLMTDNDDRNDISDLRGIAEEIKEETEFMTETTTSFSESTTKTMEIATTKSLNEKDKKMDEKTMVIGMAIAQQQKLFFDEEILSNYGEYSRECTKMFATADASVQHVFISIKESITRVKVRWKLKYLLFSDLTKSM